MQLTFSCTYQVLENIEKTMSQARLARYVTSAGADKNHALRLYVWNARLCEAFYLPTQMCEVAVRNAIHSALVSHFGDNWFERGAFLCTLPDRLKDELIKGISNEKAVYGAHMTLDHVVSGLSLGFWQQFLTSKFDGVLWPKQFAASFPNKPDHIDRQALYDMVDAFRVHRNRIAHQKPIFDRSPSREYQNILTLIRWICDDTHWFTRSLSQVQQTINLRPK